MALEHVVDVQGNTLTFQQLDSLDVYIWSSSSMPSRCNACDGIILPTIERVWSSIVLRITLVTYPVHVQVGLSEFSSGCWCHREYPLVFKGWCLSFFLGTHAARAWFHLYILNIRGAL